MDDLEQEVSALLSFEIISRFKQLLTLSGKIFDSAFNCVIYAPFSRQSSKKQHKIYMDNRKLMKELLYEYVH